MQQNNSFDTIAKKASKMINQALPNIEIFFIPFTQGLEDKALNDASHQFFHKSVIDPIFNAFGHLEKPFHYHEKITLGPFLTQKSLLQTLLSNETYIACVFVSDRILSLSPNPLFEFLAAAFPTISAVQNKNLSDQEKIDFCDFRKNTEIEQAYMNMLCDCFGIMSLNLTSSKKAISQLMKLRCNQILTKTMNCKVEFIATPIAYDITALIYEDSPKTLPQNEALRFSLNACNEIANTLPLHYAKKWLEFARKTQMLAWSNIKPYDILGMALHTCEDIDIRAIASIVCHTLNLSPSLSTYLEHYNPFAENEVNERSHKQICKKNINKMIRHIKQGHGHNFKPLLKQQNTDLIQNSPMGWSAPAIEVVMQTLDAKTNNNTDASALKNKNIYSEIQSVFLDVSDSFSWNSLVCFFEYIHEQRRMGHNFTGHTITQILEDHSAQISNAAAIRSIFAPYGDNVIYNAVQVRQQSSQAY